MLSDGPSFETEGKQNSKMVIKVKRVWLESKTRD